MTPRERLLAVLHGETPDAVPWFADLSNWFNAERKQRFIPSQDKEPDYEMIDLYKEAGAGIYIELAGILETIYEGDVEETQHIEGDKFYWTLATPVGEITEIRIYNDQSCIFLVSCFNHFDFQIATISTLCSMHCSCVNIF